MSEDILKRISDILSSSPHRKIALRNLCMMLFKSVLHKEAVLPDWSKFPEATKHFAGGLKKDMANHLKIPEEFHFQHPEDLH